MIEALILGFCAGVVAGMLGVGGGILFVPGLVLFLDASQVRAEATSLLAIIPVALVGTWRQHGYGNVRVGDGLLMGVLAAAGAVGGVAIANAISQRALEIGFAALMLVVAAQLAGRAVRELRAPAGREEHASGA
jgi:uncharacterized membrane protein YfcA